MIRGVREDSMPKLESYRIAEVPGYLELLFLEGEPFAEIFLGEDGLYHGYILPQALATGLPTGLIDGATVSEVKEALL